MGTNKSAVLGEGSSCVCLRGKDLETGASVAVKVYKVKRNGAVPASVLMRFQRQVSVLKELQEPLLPAADPRLWSSELSGVSPADLFLRLLDYSKDSCGDPGPDRLDGALYVVTELGQATLKDYLTDMRHQEHACISKSWVRGVARDIVLIVATLHAKGFAHLDVKPENLMFADGRLKLIDVDGCLRLGTRVCFDDRSVSFSPVYCAPEWARFLVDGEQKALTVAASMDVWSVGITLCEIATLNVLLKPNYAEASRSAGSGRQGQHRFYKWLAEIRRAPLPTSLATFDAEFYELLSDRMLLGDASQRSTLAECLSHPSLDVQSEDEVRASRCSVWPCQAMGLLQAGVESLSSGAASLSSSAASVLNAYTCEASTQIRNASASSELAAVCGLQS